MNSFFHTPVVRYVVLGGLIVGVAVMLFRSKTETSSKKSGGSKTEPSSKESKQDMRVPQSWGGLRLMQRSPKCMFQQGIPLNKVTCWWGWRHIRRQLAQSLISQGEYAHYPLKLMIPFRREIPSVCLNLCNQNDSDQSPRVLRYSSSTL